MALAVPWEGTEEQQGPSCLSESMCSLGLSGPRLCKDQCISRTFSVLLLNIINSGEGEKQMVGCTGEKLAYTMAAGSKPVSLSCTCVCVCV